MVPPKRGRDTGSPKCPVIVVTVMANLKNVKLRSVHKIIIFIVGYPLKKIMFAESLVKY